jgi:hypothetical protein
LTVSTQRENKMVEIRKWGMGGVEMRKVWNNEIKKVIKDRKRKKKK